ncbi:WecB/TagA/CpsF family glycosyltransferase [Desulfamplus magnetovallimortis]|nr:WecB/TagA/CpsF family glycosyltransferase [Desulfamplus magnetovallimortis]
MKRFKILNIWVDELNMKQALERVNEFIRIGKGVHTVFASNPEKNFSVPENQFLFSMFKQADMLIPDGIGMVLAARWLYGSNLERVPGCELMQNTCAMAADKGYKIFIYGAKEEVNEAAVETLKKRHPTIEIVGRQNGYLPEDEMPDLIDRINQSGAEILFLALGSPKQELWIATYRDQLKTVRVCQGIGGTLDVLAGTVKRAPEFYCKTGLEWLYRLMSEPSRLKRQLSLPKFAFQVFRSGMMKKRNNRKAEML